MLAYTPAAISSVVTPQPDFNFSNFLIGKGLSTSKNLNKRNAAKYNLMLLLTRNIETSIPATSSITILLLSSPQNSSALVPDHTATRIMAKQTNRFIIVSCGNKNQARTNVTKLAKVPGAIGKYPTEKKVAKILIIDLGNLFQYSL